MGTLKELSETINYHSEGEDAILTIVDWVEQMRIQLWDIAFNYELASKGVSKNNTIKEQKFLPEVVSRTLYRYFYYQLLPRKAILRVPPFFANYLDPTSDSCMFTEEIMKEWAKDHWKQCG